MASLRALWKRSKDYMHHLLWIGGVITGMVLASKMAVITLGVLLGLSGPSDASNTMLLAQTFTTAGDTRTGKTTGKTSDTTTTGSPSKGSTEGSSSVTAGPTRGDVGGPTKSTDAGPTKTTDTGPTRTTEGSTSSTTTNGGSVNGTSTNGGTTTTSPTDSHDWVSGDTGNPSSTNSGDVPTYTPGPIEVCNGRDDDGDGRIDEGVNVIVYADRDGDGYGDGMTWQYVCDPEPGYVTNADDCDDRDATKNLDCTVSPDGSLGDGQNPVVGADDLNIFGDYTNEGTSSQTTTSSDSSQHTVVNDSQTTQQNSQQAQTISVNDVQGLGNFWNMIAQTHNDQNTQEQAPNGQPISQQVAQSLQQQLAQSQSAAEDESFQGQGSSRGGSMCGNGTCELVMINGKASVEPLCPQDCSLSCGSEQTSAEQCRQLIQPNAFYVTFRTPDGIKKLRNLQEAGALVSITQPFTYADEDALRVELNKGVTSLSQITELLYRFFDSDVMIEPAPLFFVQDALPAGSKGVVETLTSSEVASRQRYLQAVNVPTQVPACMEQTQSDILVGVVDNAFDTRHPAINTRVEAVYDMADTDRSVLPPRLGSDREHGTIAASLVAAQKNARSQMQGSDLGTSKLVLVKTAKDTATNGDELTAGIEGLVKAAELGARIIVTSWGSPLDIGALKRVVQNLAKKGVLVVAAAGNYNTDAPFYPAAYTEALAVGAVDKFMSRAPFSNYGYWLDVAAPGVDIFASVPGNRYKIVDGTSEAAPLVAGILAAAQAFDISSDQIIQPWSALGISESVGSQIGKGVVKFPDNLCVVTQTIRNGKDVGKDTRTSQGGANTTITSQEDGQNTYYNTAEPNYQSQNGPSIIDVLLRASAGPTTYHASASDSGWSDVAVGWFSGVSSVLLFIISLLAAWWYWRKRKEMAANHEDVIA